MKSSRPRAALGTLAVLLLAACGSTVGQLPTGVGPDGGAAVSTNEMGTTSRAGANVSGAASADGGLGAAGASSAATAALPAGSRQGGPGAGPGSGADPGALSAGRSTIYIGIPYADSEAANAAAANIANGLAAGDTKQEFDALISGVNRRGGVRGAKLAATYYKINLGSTISIEEQAACAAFTQDHHVLVAVGDASPSYSTCIQKGGGALIHSSWSEINSNDYGPLRYLFQPSAVALDRLMRNYAPALKTMGYFDPGMKLGVLYYDEPHYIKAEKVLETALAKLGVRVDMKEAFQPLQQQSDIGQTQSQVQSAVLKFRAAGINHVIGVETSAWLIGFFGVYAGQQQYYPRYGYYSNEGPVAEEANVSARSLQRAVFLGYFPPADVTDHQQFTARARSCLKTFASAGVTIPDTDNGNHGALTACDDIDFLVDALKAAPPGGSTTRDTLAAGVRALGSGYRSDISFSVGFPRGFGDGSTQFRYGRFDDHCSCFVYSSGLMSFR